MIASGKPIVAISNGRTYIFENDLSSWCLVSDANDPLNACTDLKPSAVSSIRNVSSVAKIPRFVNCFYFPNSIYKIVVFSSRSLLNFFSSNTPTAQHGLISFIEQQIEASKLTASAKDYRYWLLTLAQNLVSLHSSGFNIENIEIRLRELCNFLLGQQFPRIRSEASYISNTSTPLPASRRSIGGPATGLNLNKVLGISKHELLREVLSVMASNLSLQRLYIEFKEQLDSFSPSTLNSTYLNNSSKTQQPQSGDTQSLSCIS